MSEVNAWGGSDAEERFMDANYRPEQPHGHMEGRLGLSVSYRFGYRFLEQDLFTESQWTAIREILERFYGLGDLETALIYAADQRQDGLSRRVDPSLNARDVEPDPDDELLNPVGYPWAVLPNGDLSVLEAAYEHMDDRDATMRLIMYYLLVDCMEYESYLNLLRTLAGEAWPAVRARLVELFDEYGQHIMGLTRNLAYEHLLVEEHLGEAAWRYLQARMRIDESEQVFFGFVKPQFRPMLETLAPVIGEAHREEVGALLAQPLRDADSDLLREDTQGHRMRIAEIFCQLIAMGDLECAERQRARLTVMYPRRRELHAVLDAVFAGTFDAANPPWAASAEDEEEAVCE